MSDKLDLVGKAPWEQILGLKQRIRKLENSMPEGYEKLVELCARYERRIRELEKAVALLDSMVLGGEQHSERSRAVVREALGGE